MPHPKNLFLRIDLDSVGRNDPRRYPGYQYVAEVIPRHHLAITILRCIDVRSADRQYSPEQPELFSFCVGII